MMEDVQVQFLSEASWFYVKAGQREGPVEFAALCRMVEAGELAASDLVWSEGLPQWVLVEQVPGLMKREAGKPGIQLNYGRPESVYETRAMIKDDIHGMAVTSMTLGIVGMFVAHYIFGPLAVILSSICLAKMGKYKYSKGKGQAIAGLVLGIVSVAAWMGFAMYGVSRRC